jgi:CheY-like chemotaxis protein
VNNATILVVDDEPQIRRVLRATLSSNGFDVIEAKNGGEAIEMVMRAEQTENLRVVMNQLRKKIEKIWRILFAF